MKFPALVLICAIGIADAQDRRDWQALSRLQTGDNIGVLVRSGPPVKGVFQSWTPQQITAGTLTARKDDVLAIERYRPSNWGRRKHALVGAAIGLGTGFAVGLAAGGCSDRGFGPCFPRAGAGALLGAGFAIWGAGIGALIPRRQNKELIYSVK